jgi:hypothetical protein
VRDDDTIFHCSIKFCLCTCVVYDPISDPSIILSDVVIVGFTLNIAFRGWRLRTNRFLVKAFCNLMEFVLNVIKRVLFVYVGFGVPIT